MRTLWRQISVFTTLVILIALLAIGLLMVNYNAFAKTQFFAKGDGTEESPYEISTINEFINMNYYPDAYYIQTNNIDFAGQTISPIGSITFPFTGHYDGSKYAILNVRINSNNNNVGLFSFVDGGTIENLKIQNSEIRGAFNVGAIAGTNRGTIIGCIVDSNVKVSGDGAVGGIVGLNSSKGSIKESANKGNVCINEEFANGMYIGGVAGINNSLIFNCYNSGTISSENISTYSGGIVGWNNSSSKTDASVEQSYNIGKVTGNASGQIAGDNLNGKIKHTKWLTTDNDKIASFSNEDLISNVAMSSLEFSNAGNFIDWTDFKSNWMYLDSNYPILKREYVKVESVEFKKKEVKLMPGESYSFEASVSPVHATVQAIDYIYKDNKKAGDYIAEQHIVKIKETAEIGSTITITAKAENCTDTLTITVVKIPVHKVELINTSGINEISQGRLLRFNSNVYPASATYKDVEYRVDSSYASITEDGILSIKEGTPVGLNITVNVVSIDNNTVSDSIVIKTVKESVQSVKIISGVSFKITENLILSAEVFPSNATNKEVEYEIVSSSAKGAMIIRNTLYAESEGIITVVAKADSITSEPFAIKAEKEPVTDIIFNLADSFTCDNALVLSSKVIPSNATYKNIIYTIIDNQADAWILNGVLYATRTGSVLIRATADGVSREKLITVEKVPVSDLVFKNANLFKHTESLKLEVEILPYNATNKSVIFTIIDDTANSYIKDNILYSEKPGNVTILATAENINKDFNIVVLKESVSNIQLNAEYVNSNIGEALRFTAKIYPSNATYQSVEYVLLDGNATLYDDGLLIFDETVPVGSIARVIAIADDVQSNVFEVRSGMISVEEVILASDTTTIQVGQAISLHTATVPEIVSNPGVTYRVVGNAEVINNQLFVLDNSAIGTQVIVYAIVDKVESKPLVFEVERTKAESIIFTSANCFKVSTLLKLEVAIYPVYVNSNNVSYSIISTDCASAYINNNYLYSDDIGQIVIRAQIDDIYKDTSVLVLKEPATNIVLLSEQNVKVNTELQLNSIVYPINATYKDVEYKLIRNSIGAEIFNGNILYSENPGTILLRIFADDIYFDYEITFNKEPVNYIFLNNALSFKHTESLELVAGVMPRNATYTDVTFTILTDYHGYVDIGAVIINGTLYASCPGRIVIRATADNGDIYTDFTIEVEKEPVTHIYFNGSDKYRLDSGEWISNVDLLAEVYPRNATYQDVHFEVLDECNGYYSASIINGKLVVELYELQWDITGYPSECQIAVRVLATVDGVSTERTYYFYKTPVEDYDLKINGEYYDVNNSIFKTSQTLTLDVEIIPDFVTYKDYKIELIDTTLDAVFDSNGKSLYTDFNAVQKSFAYLTVTDDEILLNAKYPGTFKVRITSLSNNFSKIFEFTSIEEEVNETQLLIGLGGRSTYQNIIEDETFFDNTDKYKKYISLDITQGQEIILLPAAYASDYDSVPSFGEKSFLEIYARIGNAEILITESNDYFTIISENTLRFRLNAPVHNQISLFVKTKCDCIPKIIGETVITIQSQALNEIYATSIDNQGYVLGLEGLAATDSDISIISSVTATVEHSSGINFAITYNTTLPTIRFQLYNKSLGGKFYITFTVHFSEKTESNVNHNYSYQIPHVTEFNGIKTSLDTIEDYYNSILFIDMISATKSSLEFNTNVKLAYIIGNASETYNTQLDFCNDPNNTVQLHLNNFNITAPDGNNAVNINNNGNVELYTVGNITIKGGNGLPNGGAGYDAIHSAGSLTINNSSTLNLYGGAGAVGNDGVSYDRSESNGGSGRAPSGGAGNIGGAGGKAIYTRNLTLAQNHATIYAYGGNGGDGGKGGNGHGSDRDGSPRAGDGGAGGAGGAGGFGIYVESTFTMNLNSNSLYIKAGDGGNGGNGGHGGHGKDAHNSDHGGHGGKGGAGGTGGTGIYAYSVNGQCEAGSLIIYSGDGGNGGKGGDGGNAYYNWGAATNGTGGSGGNGGNSGNGINVRSYNENLNNFSNTIYVGEAKAGGGKGSNGSGGGKSAAGGQVAGTAGVQGEKIYY